MPDTPKPAKLGWKPIAIAFALGVLTVIVVLLVTQ